jgi:hypothetical protein
MKHPGQHRIFHCDPALPPPRDVAIHAGYPSELSREDRIREAIQMAEVRSMTFDLATFLEQAGVGEESSN